MVAVGLRKIGRFAVSSSPLHCHHCPQCRREMNTVVTAQEGSEGEQPAGLPAPLLLPGRRIDERR